MKVKKEQRKNHKSTKKSKNLSPYLIFFTVMPFVVDRQTDIQKIYRIYAHKKNQSSIRPSDNIFTE